MIDNLLKYVFSNIYMLLFLAGFVAAGFQSLRGSRQKAEVVECFLSTFILFNIGFSL